MDGPFYMFYEALLFLFLQEKGESQVDIGPDNAANGNLSLATAGPMGDFVGGGEPPPSSPVAGTVFGPVQFDNIPDHLKSFEDHLKSFPGKLTKQHTILYH